MKLHDFHYSGAQPSLTLRSGVPVKLAPVAFWRELLKLNIRALAYRRETKAWLHLLNSHPAFSELARHCPKLVHKIYRPYLSGHLKMDQRRAVLASHYRFMFTRGLGPMVMQASRCGVQLADIAGKNGAAYQLVLRAVEPLEREGELVLQLRQQDALIYSTAFTFSDLDGTVVVSIGCIQGTKGADGLAKIRDATRELHGLRPKQLLVLLVQQLGHQLGCTQLRLVGNGNRAVRGAMRQGRVQADYEQLWKEMGAEPRADGDFQLGCGPIPELNLEPIASKKRSEARKRHQTLVSFSDAVAAHFHLI